MKSLLLVRHAQSTDKEPGQHDINRVLTAEGERQSHDIGNHLISEGIVPLLILCSSAVRTKQTASIVAECIQYPTSKIKTEHSIYESTTTNLLHLIQQLEESVESVLLVGHNPAVAALGEYLTAERIGNVEPADLLHIEFDIALWRDVKKGNGKLVSHVKHL